MAELYESASYWTTQYEIWTLADDPKRILSARIPLDRSDTRRQYRHSLQANLLTPGLVIQFPVSISPCVHRFAILNRIYALQVAPRGHTPKGITTALPLGLDDDLTPYWGLQNEDQTIADQLDFQTWRS